MKAKSDQGFLRRGGASSAWPPWVRDGGSVNGIAKECSPRPCRLVTSLAPTLVDGQRKSEGFLEDAQTPKKGRRKSCLRTEVSDEAPWSVP
jgi:hypothetical protein